LLYSSLVFASFSVQDRNETSVSVEADAARATEHKRGPGVPGSDEATTRGRYRRRDRTGCCGPLRDETARRSGARVIKIERPDGGDFARGYDTGVKGMASHFVWLNRSKETLTLDLKRPEATVVLQGADIFLQNLAPGAIDRLGLGADTLRQRYPRLIVCNLSGYRTSGPYADKKAYDLIIQSEFGMLSVTGTEATPSKVGVSIADMSAGMYAYSGSSRRCSHARTRAKGRSWTWR
jgi:crotonobetainyl-CoA:carnitine CoA-transferase CaiB-like acyl-CoA transferase